MAMHCHAAHKKCARRSIEAMESVKSLFGEEIALYEMLSDINDQLTAMADLCYEIDGGRQDIEPEDLQNFLTSDK